MINIESEIKTKKQKGFFSRIKPENYRPIRTWSDLTDDEQQVLSKEYLALTTLPFTVRNNEDKLKSTMTLSLLEIQETFFKGRDKVNVVVKQNDPIFKTEARIQFQAFIETYIYAMQKSGMISKVLSAKLQRILMYYVFEVQKDNIAVDSLRERAKIDYEQFLEDNKELFDCPEREGKILSFIMQSVEAGG